MNVRGLPCQEWGAKEQLFGGKEYARYRDWMEMSRTVWNRRKGS